MPQKDELLLQGAANAVQFSTIGMPGRLHCSALMITLFSSIGGYPAVRVLPERRDSLPRRWISPPVASHGEMHRPCSHWRSLCQLMSPPAFS